MLKIKLLIVDDELTSRNTLKGLLRGSDDYEVAADFADARQALAWLRENEVDILLCDMQMPEIDGVELIRLVHIINEFLPVIAISGFDNFDYVRGSLINGTANYLLKHELTRERLIEALDQVREKYRITPTGRPVCRRAGYCIRNAWEFTEKHIRELCEEGRISFVCSNIVPIALSPDYRFPADVRPGEYRRDIQNAVLDILAQIIGTEYPYLVCVTERSYVMLLVAFPEVRSLMYLINILRNLTARLQKQILRLLDLTVTVITGGTPLPLGKAIGECRRAETLLEDKLYLGGDRVETFQTVVPVQYGDGDIPDSLWRQLAFDLENDTPGGPESLNEFFTRMKAERYRREHVAQICRRIVSLLRDDEKSNKQLFERLDAFELLEQFRAEILMLYEKRKQEEHRAQPPHSPMIRQVLEYIDQNYRSEISLESCAQEAGVSYTHLSRAFKAEMGMRFVEYLNGRRIVRAKSLLIRGALPMKEIVEQSGFRGYNYFFTVFKEREGVTPSDFAAKN